MEQTEKTEHIIEAAIKRFAHFGVHKTTLTEIADDLGITKQALAYYFPDKQALLEAVEQKIITEFFQLVNEHATAAPNAELSLLSLLEVKKSFFDKYAMLMQQVGPEMLANFSRVAESRKKVQAAVAVHIAQVLEQGIAKGELKPMDTTEVSMVLYETMSAYEHCFVGRQAVPDPHTFSEMCIRQKAVMQLIINGLKAN
ncbi:TetR/AcrR family transcriptional regulator [Paracnuella aquatica]|uniref:TetR/AcrR family transcriptional regulator n=1 Tax=Paracnuella aquatica TaxID=2268757 RepID=UPI000DEF4FB5|nr:TetR/AcrR family transcriptional regulator [Paracnuella aquatica]RPD48842.1 TetR/AcrR family transcriptional regulator [Paracnuella aquatica]